MDPRVNMVHSGRIADDLWKLVRVPSPTGNEKEAAALFGRLLKKAGARVRVIRTFARSPSVVGRLKGNRPGPVLQLAGHLDTIPVAHAAPRRTKSVIAARGAADMKNGLAAILGIVRILNNTGCDFPGEILVTAYGLHEAPGGHSEGLLDLVKKGIKGDAAVIFETGYAAEGKVVTCGKGQAIWEITLTRTGKSCHELNFPENGPDLGTGLVRVLERLKKEDGSLKKYRHRLLGRESLFTGQVHYGDFYNRVPQTCTLQGTRRWLAGRSFGSVKKEMGRLLKRIRLPRGVSAACTWNFVGEAYAVDTAEPIVQAQVSAIKKVNRKKPDYAGLAAVVDAHRLVPLAGVPSVLFGFDTRCAHADHEEVRLNRLKAPARAAFLTVLHYLNHSQGY